nr:hypothetical protein [Tanacetum cinerariifolium]
MMIYLKNMTGFKMEFFKGMSYEEIKPLFEEEYNKVQTLFKEGLEIDAERIKDSRKRTRKEKIEKDQTVKKQKVPDDKDDVFMNVAPLSSKPPIIVDYKIYKGGKKEHFQIIRANGNHQMYLAFSIMLKNFDREDLEVMFEHTVEDSVWKLQKKPKGLTRVKNWKLFDSCRVHCVTLDTIQLYLLAEKIEDLEVLWKIVKDRFKESQPKEVLDVFLWHTLKMFNEVRLQVDYDVEMTYDLLRLIFMENIKFKGGLLGYKVFIKLLLLVIIMKKTLSVSDVSAKSYCCQFKLMTLEEEVTIA